MRVRQDESAMQHAIRTTRKEIKICLNKLAREGPRRRGVEKNGVSACVPSASQFCSRGLLWRPLGLSVVLTCFVWAAFVW